MHLSLHLFLRSRLVFFHPQPNIVHILVTSVIWGICAHDAPDPAHEFKMLGLRDIVLVDDVREDIHNWLAFVIADALR